MAGLFPSAGMDAWPQRRAPQTMNLRSVFTAEQQRTLERYYDKGMTNQSKACFQLILQCAQETKLDFSVVRTWVGNKRRKLASKVEQNGSVSHSLSGHGISGGLLSNHSLAGATLSNHGLAAGVLFPGDMAAAARSIQNRVHLLPQTSSFPSFSSASSSPSSSSPLSSGSNNNNSSNNDVILTGIYSLNSLPRSQPRPTALSTQSDSELSAHTSSTLINQVLQSRNISSPVSSSLHSKITSLSQTLPSLTSASGPLVYTAIRKDPPSIGDGSVSAGTGVVPHSWTRQYGTPQTRPWSSASQPQTQPQPRPRSNPQPQLSAPPRKLWVPSPTRTSNSTSENSPLIREVFTLSEKRDRDRLVSGQPSARRLKDTPRLSVHSQDTIYNFSIAMETGDEEDEWQREEELANMAAQTHIHRERSECSPTKPQVSGMRRSHSPPESVSKPASLQSTSTLQGSYSLTAQTSSTGETSSQTSLDASAAPWVMSNSRKRTLQDRTQFSDADLIQLKRYWDRGMTSLGSVCKEKITAAADQLNVDTEIVKTWISNRRRKYRLMGIEIPPPTGGPAVFTNSPPGNDSPAALSVDGERLATPDLEDDLNDDGSVCLSEDGTVDSHQRDDDEDVFVAAPMANNVKVEVFDEDDEADAEVEFVASDLEQMQNLLEFKHEEVQFLEHELDNQKQKYLELANFTKSLLCAVRKKDLKRQQELLASLPQPSEQDWDGEEEHQPDTMPDQPDAETDDPSTTDCVQSRSTQDFLLVTVKRDGAGDENTEPSASEDHTQEATVEHK